MKWLGCQVYLTSAVQLYINLRLHSHPVLLVYLHGFPMSLDEKLAPVAVRNVETDGESKFSSNVIPSYEEKLLVRRLDMRIMPIACILYLFACT